MKEETMSSAKRIQLLRERLEMYNATIVEAMGVVAASSASERDSGLDSSTASAMFWRPTSRQRANDAANHSSTSAGNTQRSRMHLDIASTDGHGHKDAFKEDTQRNERRVVPPPPSPPVAAPEEPRELLSTSGSTTVTTESGDETDSGTVYTDTEEECDEPCLNARDCPDVLQAPGDKVKIGDERFSASLTDHTNGSSGNRSLTRLAKESWSMVQTPVHTSDKQLGSEANCLTQRRGSAAELVRSLDSSVRDLRHPPVPDSVSAARTASKASASQVSFATLELFCGRVSACEQAIRKLQEVIDAEHFPRSLPQRHKSLQLAEARDELARREQVLRHKGSSEPSIAALHDNDVVSLTRNIHRVLEECAEVNALFRRVHERRAIVAEKEKLLQQRQDELEARQAELRERRQALISLERRTDQREARLLKREEAYQKDVATHKEREKQVKERAEGVDALGRKVCSWMKILEGRDSAMALKEKRLRRVQSDLLRRSEEVMSFRGSRERHSLRMSPRLDQSP
ncbi:hypothetical protein TRVL_05856 [Trypanosoma vivax]|uniref:Uncharacterized protein n=1 Tax=Trypanosoma vivax (strain Y486) TaxID=1055687 RepID=G0TWK7_TRYVY|nr:hypothetical protein TRVL_05856 [Trypanosoma vivax]CCC48345.1 conserved hypothetical protein [Trypanosoma vivax Y486]